MPYLQVPIRIRTPDQTWREILRIRTPGRHTDFIHPLEGPSTDS